MGTIAAAFAVESLKDVLYKSHEAAIKAITNLEFEEVKFVQPRHLGCEDFSGTKSVTQIIRFSVFTPN